MVKTNILLADDEELIRKFLTQALTKHKYMVFSASDGEEAVRLAGEHEIDIAILDISMPIIDGLEASRRIQEINPLTQILIITGRSEASLLFEAFSKHDIFDYLFKPLELHMLLKSVEECIQNLDRLRLGQVVGRKEANLLTASGELYQNKKFELRDSQLKFKNIVEHSRDMIVIVQDEKIQYANPRALEITGYSIQELEKLTLSDVVYPSDYPVIISAYENRLWEKSVQSLISFRIPKKDKSLVWVEMNLIGTTWQEKPAVLIILRDISERIQSENELRIRDYAIASSSNPVAFADLEGILTYANQAFINILGMKVESEILGKPIWDFIGCPLDGQLSDEAKKVSELQSYSSEAEIKRSDGAHRHVHYTINSVVDSSSKPICLMVYIVDITHQKNMTDLMLRSEKLSALGQFAAGLAHELKNPLAVISSCSQFCLDHLSPDKLLKENLQVIYRNSLRANRLIGELLNFARPPRLEWKEVDIHEIIEKAIRMVNLEPRSYDINYLLNFDKENPKILADEDKLGQVFVNIIINAVQSFSSKGQIIINTRFLPSEETLQVDIEDNGPGIPDEYRQRIFDPFFTTKDGGTGLGLSICQSIIAEHGGDIEVDCPSGGGTRISVHFPYNRSLPEGR